jgi:hypothetical protein
MLLLGSEDGFVRVAENWEGTNDLVDDQLSDGTGGTSFTMQARARRFFFGAPQAEKAFRHVYCAVEGTPSATATVDWATSAASGSALIGAAGAPTRVLHAGGRGEYLDLTITEPGNSDAVYSALGADAFVYGERG